MSDMQTRYPSSIREEELKNKVAADFFGAFDCTRIIGNIDFCVAGKVANHSLYWAEAKNHPTDVHRMLAQLILTFGRAGSPLPADSAVAGRPPYQGDLFAVARDARPYQGDESAWSRVPRDRSSLQGSKTPSSESNAARAVMDAGRELWRYYHAQPGANPNASYYDIRLHFQGVKRTASGKEQMNSTSSDATYNTLLANLRSAHKAIAAHIAPKVYEYGFLKR